MQKRITPHFLFFFFLITMISSLHTQPMKPAFRLEDTLMRNPKLTKGVLSNGFTYYILPNAYPKQKVEFRLFVNAGSLQETEQQLGLAHFMEHMNFNGSRYFKKNELIHYFQSIGVSFGADINAYTTFDKTVYMLPVPSTKPSYIEDGFKVMADWAYGALLTDKEIESERGVVLEESRLSKGATRRFTDTMIQLIAPNYAARMPIGKDKIIQHFAPDTLRSFYKDWYRPDLTALAIVGDIDPEQAQKLVEKYFNSWQAPTSPQPLTNLAPTPITQHKSAVFVDKEMPQYVLNLLFSMQPTHPIQTLADYKEALTKDLISAIFAFRITELTQNATPPFAFADINIDGFFRGYDGLQVSLSPAQQGIDFAVESIVKELKKAQLYGFTNAELEIAKKDLLSAAERHYKERDKIPNPSFMDELMNDFLQGDIAVGGEDEFAYINYLLPLITQEDLTRVLTPYIQSPYFCSILGVPEAKQTAAPKDGEALTNLVHNIWKKVSVEKPKEIVLDTKLLNEEPLPGAVRSIQEDPNFPSTQFKLSNGIKVVLKPTTYKEDQILIQFVAEGGSSNLPAEQKYAATVFSGAMRTMGWGKFTMADLQKVLAGKEISVSPFLGERTHGFSGSSTVKDLSTFFEMLYLQINHPRWDESMLQSFLKRNIAATQALEEDPMNRFADTLSKVLYQNNPLTPIAVPFPRYLKKVQLADLKDIYSKYYQRPAGYTLFVVGNTNQETLQPLLEKYIASLKVNNATPLLLTDNGMRPLRNNEVFQYKTGKEDKSLIIYRYYKEMPFNSMLAVRSSLLASMLSMLMTDEIREKHSWVYTSSANEKTVNLPIPFVVHTLSFPCSVNNVDSILNVVPEEIAKFKLPKHKKTAAIYLQRAQQQALESLRVSMETNGYWLGSLVGYTLFKREAAFYTDLAHMIQKVSVKDIQQLCSEIFTTDNLFRAVLYPEFIKTNKK